MEAAPAMGAHKLLLHRMAISVVMEWVCGVGRAGWQGESWKIKISGHGCKRWERPLPGTKYLMDSNTDHGEQTETCNLMPLSLPKRLENRQLFIWTCALTTLFLWQPVFGGTVKKALPSHGSVQTSLQLFSWPQNISTWENKLHRSLESLREKSQP